MSAKTLQQAASTLTAYVADMGERSAQRRHLLGDLKGGSPSPQEAADLHSFFQRLIQEAEQLNLAVALLKTAIVNAEPTIGKMAAQAKKDVVTLEAFAKKTGGAGSERELDDHSPLVKELNAAIAIAAQRVAILAAECKKAHADLEKDKAAFQMAPAARKWQTAIRELQDMEVASANVSKHIQGWV